MSTIFFVGGGSAGHIAPSVAIWEACQKLIPGTEAHFVCSDKPSDAAFLKNADLKHTALKAPRLSPGFPITFTKALKASLALLDKHKPDVILSKGGYVSVPMCLAAKYDGIPIVLHESDTVNGNANKFVSLFAQEICTGFPSKHHHTGNPVRSDIAEGSKKAGLKLTGLTGDRPILLIMGGSQGAQSLNDYVAKFLSDILLRCDVVHITGTGKQTVADNPDGYFQIEFADSELKDLYACATAAVSRAGAGSLAELAVCGIPTIVVPLRGVGHDHQFQNARVASATGGCIHIEQSEMNTELLPAIHTVVSQPEVREQMAKNIASLGSPDAALQIAKIIAKTLDYTKQGQ